MSETKDLSVSKGNEVATTSQVAQSSLGITANDIIIPKVLLMQAISEAVKARKIYAGQFLHSIDEVEMTSPLEFIVLNYFKEILTFEDKKYVKKEAWTHQKEVDLVREEIKGALVIQKSISHNFTIILTKDIEEMTPFPMVVSFKKTSVKAGKKLCTQLLMLEEFGAKPQDKTFKLSSKEESGDNGSYFVFEVSPGRKTTDEEKKVAYRWADRMKVVNVIVDDKDEEVAAGSPSGSAEAPKDVKVDANINF